MSCLIVFFVFSIVVSTTHAIACYQHYDICGQSSTCLVDANKKNCTGEDQNYCAKDDWIFSLATRGCADAAYCNSTLLLGIRHCCETDYCNQAVIKHRTTWLTVFIALLVTRGAFSH